MPLPGVPRPAAPGRRLLHGGSRRALQGGALVAALGAAAAPAPALVPAPSVAAATDAVLADNIAVDVDVNISFTRNSLFIKLRQVRPEHSLCPRVDISCT